MEVRTTVIETKKEYVAFDGKSFDKSSDCEVYEKYAPLTLYDILKDYCNIEEKDVDSMKQNKFNTFSYLIVHTPIPRDKYKYCSIIELSESGIPNIFECEKEEPILFYNDWTNAYNGGYGSNGWTKIGSLSFCYKKIQYYSEMANKFTPKN